MRLYDAVKLASRQPAEVSPDNSRAGTQYFLFASPGSAACNAAARARASHQRRTRDCLLSGPAASPQQLATALPTGVTAAQGQDLAIKPGTVVLQAASPNAKSQTSLSLTRTLGSTCSKIMSRCLARRSPARGSGPTVRVTGRCIRLYLRGQAGLPKGHPRGRPPRTAQRLLVKPAAQPAFRGRARQPAPDRPVDRLPAYPNGIPGNTGADITAALTIQSARDLATELRLGALPLNLRLIDEQPLRTIHP